MDKLSKKAKSVLTFTKEQKESTNAYRYAEEAENDEYMVGTLYVRKRHVDGAAPERLVVTIEAP